MLTHGPTDVKRQLQGLHSLENPSPSCDLEEPSNAFSSDCIANTINNGTIGELFICHLVGMIQTEIKYAIIHYKHFPGSLRDISKSILSQKSTLSRWVRSSPRCLPVAKRNRTTKYT
jgi:hypothetical protein